jgi:hypothetical protein
MEYIFISDCGMKLWEFTGGIVGFPEYVLAGKTYEERKKCKIDYEQVGEDEFNAYFTHDEKKYDMANFLSEEDRANRAEYIDDIIFKLKDVKETLKLDKELDSMQKGFLKHHNIVI